MRTGLRKRSAVAPFPRDRSARWHRLRNGATQGGGTQALRPGHGYSHTRCAFPALEPDNSRVVTENIIGWGSTLILIATLGAQIGTQIASGKASNVSPWLFVGQCAASLGFLAYSALVGNAVFVVSNALILVTALIG